MQTENVNEKSALIDLFKNTYSRPSDPKLGCHLGTPGTRKSPFGALSIWHPKCFACVDYMGDMSLKINTWYIDFSEYRIILKYNNQRRSKRLTFRVKFAH